MTRKTHRFVPFVLALVAILAAAQANAQATANGPYYATPSWDQKLQCDTTSTCPRFIVLANWNNDAVLDRETGLVWEKVPNTATFTSFDALFQCGNLNLGGRTGWRLPARAELLSLVDRSQSNPSLPAGHPFTVQSSGYWSATTIAELATQAWVVLFDHGDVGSAFKSGGWHAWCVRGGPGVDPQ